MFERDDIAALVADHGAVVRVVIAAHQGSSPREPGAAMLVWPTRAGGFGQSGTIGGGALEFAAARRALGVQATQVERVPLGPGLGQCCGGAVTLVYERIDAGVLAQVPGMGLHARRVEGTQDMPLPLARALRTARGQGAGAHLFRDGWLAEPVAPARRAVWVWGAGHVGRAIIATLAPLPGLALTWVDTTQDRFPDAIPQGVLQRIAQDPVTLVPQAPQDAEHLVLTFSHALDLALCHALVAHGFARCGLIGSASKAARFRSRLQALGHAPAQIARIQCPIGDPRLGKHPQQIAIGVAHDLLLTRAPLAKEVLS
jgi:xanthine dehydrogenase accessory factor